MSDWILPVVALVALAAATVQALSGFGGSPCAAAEGDRAPKRGKQRFKRDYTPEAEALFKRFAERHELTYRVETDVPMEVCWAFPEQPKLFLPLTLGLQNYDELNFGVSDFWSYFFPFDNVADRFEHLLDAWVAGNARIAIMRGAGRLLQVREDAGWTAIYGANGCLFPFRRWPRGFVQNVSGVEAHPGL